MGEIRQEKTFMDVNCDLGETPLLWHDSHEPDLMAHITSANVACGGHAGDVTSMQAVCASAVVHGVAIGAQVSYPDREHFGRIAMEIDDQQLDASLEHQFMMLAEIARNCGTRVTYIKPHGALYNTVATNEAHAAVVVALAQRHQVALFGLANSATARLASQHGVRFVSEWFADRSYFSSGLLTPRSRPDALVTEPDHIYARVTQVLKDGTVSTVDGGLLAVHAETICVHSDTPGAAELLRAVQTACADAGVVPRAR